MAHAPFPSITTSGDQESEWPVETILSDKARVKSNSFNSSFKLKSILKLGTLVNLDLMLSLGKLTQRYPIQLTLTHICARCKAPLGFMDFAFPTC